MIASERKYLASRESSEDFLLSPHHTSRILNPENYSPSNYRTLIKAGVAENGKGTLPWHFCNKKNYIPYLAGVWRKCGRIMDMIAWKGRGPRVTVSADKYRSLLCDKNITHSENSSLGWQRRTSIWHIKNIDLFFLASKTRLHFGLFGRKFADGSSEHGKCQIEVV